MGYGKNVTFLAVSQIVIVNLNISISTVTYFNAVTSVIIVFGSTKFPTNHIPVELTFESKLELTFVAIVSKEAIAGLGFSGESDTCSYAIERAAGIVHLVKSVRSFGKVQEHLGETKFYPSLTASDADNVFHVGIE